ncbi:hypothetical protein H0O00_04095 [Candidatus Micrarchaeota archaeon]|nr:hypothetical protein [Candidatus Micrarchaeota archaeon]
MGVLDGFGLEVLELSGTVFFVYFNSIPPLYYTKIYTKDILNLLLTFFTTTNLWEGVVGSCLLLSPGIYAWEWPSSFNPFRLHYQHGI